MKQNVLDKSSKTGRLRARLEEIVALVEDRELPRMDGGDTIGREIVANLLGAARRTEEESRLLYEAQLARARLYQESSGATALEAAEALAEARATLRELSPRPADLEQLVEPAWRILEDLLDIGSRETALRCLGVLFDGIEVARGHDELRPKLVPLFVRLNTELLDSGRTTTSLASVLRVALWARQHVPDDFESLVSLIPQLLARSLEKIDTDTALSAYLFARQVSVDFDRTILEAVVFRLASEERMDAEARSVYQEFLGSDSSDKEEARRVLERLAYVNPDPDLTYDANLDALNVLLADRFPDVTWVWHNRALLFRRRKDPFGALACLARAMNVSGDPPEVMGLLAPVLVAMGFHESAREFCRFVRPDVRKAYQLDLLELAAAVPGGEEGARKLLGQLESRRRTALVPPEFRDLLDRRCADLLYELGDLERATAFYADLLERDPSDELAAVRLAEVALRNGQHARVEKLLRASFTPRVRPLIELLSSRVAESAGDLPLASRHTELALQSIAPAQNAGRERKHKSVVALRERIERMHGPEYVDCALLGLLEVETHSSRHLDLDALEPVLDRRAVDLALRSGDAQTARQVIKELVSRRPAETEIFVAGVRASLRSGEDDDAAEFLERAEAAGHGDSAEVWLLRGLLAARRDELAEARTWILRAMERVPTAEARFALASLELRDGNEAGARDILGDLREQEGGTEDLRARIADLHGRLLERAGRKEEALVQYLESHELADGWTEARRRAGLLAVQFGLADDATTAKKPKLLKRGVSLLEGFLDQDSITHEALARAALAAGPEEATRLLGTYLKRTSGESRCRLELVRLRHLLDLGRLDEARTALDDWLDEEPPASDDLRVRLGRVRAWLLRQRALATVARASDRPSDVWQKVAPDLDAASSLSPSKRFDEVAYLLATASGAEVERRTKRPRVPLSLTLVRALIEGGASAKSQTNLRRRLGDLDEHGGHGLHARVVRLLENVSATSGPASPLLAVIDDFEAAGLSLPYARIDLLRLVGIKAINNGDEVALDRALERAPNRLEELRTLRRLLSIASSRRDEDASTVLGLLLELKRQTGASIEDGELEARTTSIRNNITELKETPSPAWASARLRTAGKRTRVHVVEVLEFWEGRVRAAPDDVRALHQVALMRLARAHESESVGADGAAEWIAAHEAWTALLACDAFWVEKSRGVRADDANPAVDVVGKLRQQLPRWLLDAHLAYARRRLFAGDLARAIRHGRLVATSPLLGCVDAGAVRDDLFSSLSGELERHLHQRHFEEAILAIDHVIVADPDNPTARREMTRISAEALRSDLAVIDALTSPPDAAMISDTCALLARVLVTAERPIRDLAAAALEGHHLDRSLALDLGICLRAIAYIEMNRHHRPHDAAELLDQAIHIVDEAGGDSNSLRRSRSDIGLEVVEQTMRGGNDGDGGIGIEDPIDVALGEVDRLIALDPDNVKVLSQKARLLLVCRRDEEAENVARDLFMRAQRKSDPARLRGAVELLHQVQSGRERLRYESQVEMVRGLVAQQNWRAALQILKDAIVGRENEPEHIVLHTEVLLGLRKLNHAEELVERLADCDGYVAERRRLLARLACLQYVKKVGGDLYSAYDLLERGQVEKSLVLGHELVARSDRDPVAQMIVAQCLVALGEDERATGHAEAAIRNAKPAKRPWISTLLEEPEKTS